MRSLLPVFFAAALLAEGNPLKAATATFTQPDFDRWNYPFNGSNGTRNASPTFGAVGTTFDDRDGQFLIGFNTSGETPALAPGQTFQINSAVVTATHSSGSFLYDPTYDSYVTYLDASDPNHIADSDDGRPISLTGAGLRNSYTDFAFSPTFEGNAAPPNYQEDEIFGLGDPTAKETRSAFPYDPNSVANDTEGDISNNVADGFDFEPWALGITSVNPGDAVIEADPGNTPGSTFTFDINVNDPAIQAYLRDGLLNGGLFFSITSLHSTTQEGGSNPNFYNRDSFDPAAKPATLSLTFDVVPEPSSALLTLAGVITLLCRRRT